MGQNESSQTLSDAEKAGVEFLRVDFGQSYQQMRHYEQQHINICKFAFFVYTSITGAAIGLYKFGIKNDVDLQGLASVIVVIGLSIGLLLFWITLRNRVYFVRVTRYINDIRKIFLKNKPMGFENESRMYTDNRRPAFYNFDSSQIWFCHLLAFLNTILLGALLYTLECYNWIVFACVLFVILQEVSGILYLKRYDNKYKEGKPLTKGGKNE